jgi:RNA polymerase sigma factor (sigma-70 family)
MVWGVCRRLLNHHDAEDAFQATFLVLVRKAADVPRQAVANWLYGVARQTAVRLWATTAKRGRRETQVVNMPEPTVPEVRDADLRAVVDEEVSRLPNHYRGVVLCDLAGMTRREAARQLGIPEGSVASRLARARALLAKRLGQRGVLFSGSAASVLSGGSAESAPPALVASTIKAASLLAAGRTAGVVSAKVAALTEGVVNAMFVTKIKSVLAVGLVIAALGAAALVYQTPAAEDPKVKEEPSLATQEQKKGEQEKGKNEKLRTLIDKVLIVHGGEEKLRKLNFIEEVENPNLPDPTSVKYFVQSPARFREELSHGLDKKCTIHVHILQNDGMKRWNTYPKEWVNRLPAEKEQWGGPDPMIDYWLDYVKFFGPRRVLRLKDAEHRMVLLDDVKIDARVFGSADPEGNYRVDRLHEVKIDGRPAVGVKLTKTGPKFKLSLKMFFDKETNLLVKEENDLSYSAIIYPPLGYTPEWSPHEENVQSSSAVFYTDYKKFDGIPIAQKEIYTANGNYASETKVVNFRAVEKMNAKLFEQP